MAKTRGHALQLINSANLLPKFVLKRMKRRRAQFLRDMLPEGGVGAEFGVQRGLFSLVISHVLKPERLHLVDPWYLLGPQWDWALGNKSTVAALRGVLKLFENELASGEVVLHIGFDFDVMPTFPDGYFDWVYIDTSHTYDATVRELSLVKPKMKPEGIIAGDNWEPTPGHPFHGVFQAVEEFVAAEGYAYLHRKDHGIQQFAIRRDV